jgi:F0F1-type ATP synthase alpha subunit
LLKTIDVKYQKIHALYQKSLDITNNIYSTLNEENFDEVQKLITERETNLFSAEKLLSETQIIKAEIIKNNKLSKLDKNEIAKFSETLAGSIETGRLKLIEDIKNIQKIQLKIEEKFNSIKAEITKKVNNVDVTKKIHNAYNKNKINQPVKSFLFF